VQNLPPIWPIQGKVWGTTQCVFKNDTVEIWIIRTKKGGFCSHHYHNHKWNRFILLEGAINVKVFMDDEEDQLIDETTLAAGQATDVSPGRWHVFESLEASVALEVYWVSLDPDDIVRRTHGGLRESS
jgi:mannose-6-phosphate isomerase-like protein (cupin superfamily)